MRTMPQQTRKRAMTPAMWTQHLDSVEKTVRHMLTESTGVALMDSGGDEGRHWQQNAKQPPWEKPRLNVSTSYRKDGDRLVRPDVAEDGNVELNVYHYLTGDAGLARDERAREFERAFYAWCKREDVEPHFGALQSWFEESKGFEDEEDGHGRARFGIDPQRAYRAFNTYNWCGRVTQTLQGVYWREGHEWWLALQVHQGADVRGGYTDPRFFRFEVEPRLPGEQLRAACPECDDEVEVPEFRATEKRVLYDVPNARLVCKLHECEMEVRA